MARVFLKRLNSSTAARLYTFRAVILSTLSTAIASAFFAAVFSYPNPVVYGPCILCLITIFHHLLMLSPWLINFTVADIVLVGTELIGFCVLLSFLDSANTTLGAFLAVNIAALCFSLYFRYVGRNLERFNLFGGCNWAHPPYKSWEIILGRSALRPLVRGESQAIAVFRAMILALLCFAIPAFGGYFALVVPIRAIVMTRNIEMNQSWQSPAEFPHSTGVDLVRENITLLFFYTSRLDSAIEVTVARTFQGTATDIFFLNSMNVLESWAAHGSYDYSWLDLSETQDDLIVTSDLPDARGILYVKAGQGNPSDVNSYAEAIPLTNGSHISAILSRRQRDLFSKNAQDIFGITTTFRSIMVNPVLLLQPDPSPPLDWAVSLRLRMRDDMNAYPTELVQDYTDASVLNGIATFGGFWTFVNGVFATVFGANLLYFLLRRRTLSALGIVHLFQRRKLTRNWNEDFPALHTEGGQPGSSSAGIVAFLRERLVDLDDEDSHLGDLEAQHPPSDSDQSAASKDEADTVSPLADEEIITQEVTATPP